MSEQEDNIVLINQPSRDAIHEKTMDFALTLMEDLKDIRVIDTLIEIYHSCVHLGIGFDLDTVQEFINEINGYNERNFPKVKDALKS